MSAAKSVRVTKKSVSSKSSLPPIKCKGCDVIFVPKDRRQHFHSPTCRNNYYQTTYFAKTSTLKICANCGAQFTTTKPLRQIYCDNDGECRRQAQLKRIADREGRAMFAVERYKYLKEDNFTCTLCGNTAKDKVRLFVEEGDDGNLHTICELCSVGRRRINKDSNANTV